MTVTPSFASGYAISPSLHQVTFRPSDAAMSLRGVDKRRRLLLRVFIDHVILPLDTPSASYRLDAVGYQYQLLDPDRREVLAYHWHPTGVSPITFPHLHLSGRLPPLDLGARFGQAAIGNMHLPTGPVTLADIVRLLITEFGVQPRRSDWVRVLDANRNPFGPAG